jgi:non-specific serine/threonine protein kinase/serine/threonine-protein kinase
MSPSRRERVDELLRSTLNLPDTEREPFLTESCAGDPSLRSEVESLLRERSTGVNGDLSTVVAVSASHERDEGGEPLIGRRIGTYRVVQELGRGGMGAVYLAVRDDDEFQRRVAIKVIKLGLDTDEVRRRFRTERQILAGLDHPNIARLLDGGTTDDGLSYFVMEYVEGTPIDTYCDTNRLTLAERLRLFRTVCSAVHAAHQNLVVHRDIKPSNILVAKDRTAKLLDFGIAKLLNPELAGPTIVPTGDGVRPMTPTYASPEQLRGEPVTTASDVYSLGVLLYLLLTGRRPYRFRSLAPREVERVVSEEEPERPSVTLERVEESSEAGGRTSTLEAVSRARDSQPDKLRRELRGDLDTIVLMALRKEPQRRYPSADAFSEDIGRYLDGLPVVARRDTVGYRVSKFVKRHRAGVAAAALVAVALVGGLVATTYSARIARREQARAQARFDDVRGLATSAMLEMHDAIADLPGSTRARQLLVSRALDYLNRLAREAADDPGLASDLAVAYERVGDVQGNPYDANLGDVAGALTSYRKALGIRQRLIQRDSSPARLAELAESHQKMVDVLLASDDIQGALDNARVALRIRRQLVTDTPAAENSDARRGVAHAVELFASALEAAGDYAGSLAANREGIAIREETMRRSTASLTDQRNLAVLYGKVGRVLALTNDMPAALDFGNRSLTMLEQVAAQQPSTRTNKRELAIGYDQMGDLRLAAGDRAGALTSYRKASEIRQALLDADPANVQARRDFATISGDIGLALAESGARQEALDRLSRATEIFQQLAAEDPANAIARRDLSKMHQAAGRALLALGNASGALDRFEQGIAIAEPLAAASPWSAVVQRDLAVRYFGAAECHESLAKGPVTDARLEHWRAARNRYEQSLRAWLAIQGRMPQAAPQARIDEANAAIARSDSALARGTKQ